MSPRNTLKYTTLHRIVSCRQKVGLETLLPQRKPDILARLSVAPQSPSPPCSTHPYSPWKTDGACSSPASLMILVPGWPRESEHTAERGAATRDPTRCSCSPYTCQCDPHGDAIRPKENCACPVGPKDNPSSSSRKLCPRCPCRVPNNSCAQEADNVI